MVRRTPKGEAGGSIPFWRAKKIRYKPKTVCSGFFLVGFDCKVPKEDGQMNGGKGITFHTA